MSELTLQALGETAASQPTQAACGQPRAACGMDTAATQPTTPVLGLSGWNADMAARQRRLLRDQDAQLRILRDLVEDMREMNRSALEALEALS